VANIGTATIKIIPEFDSETLAALDDTLREAVAASLRRLADGLTAKAQAAASEDTPASPEPALWGYNIGDRVAYTSRGLGATGTVRVVGAVRRDFDGTPNLRLDHPDRTAPGIGHAYSPSDIRPA
jgi:hypothetical protein